MCVLIINSLNQANSEPSTESNQGPSHECVSVLTKALAPLKMTLDDLKKAEGWAKLRKKYSGTEQWKALRLACDPSAKQSSKGDLVGSCDCSKCASPCEYDSFT